MLFSKGCAIVKDHNDNEAGGMFQAQDCQEGKGDKK